MYRFKIQLDFTEHDGNHKKLHMESFTEVDLIA